MFGDKFKFLDKRTIDTKISPEKRYAWLNDQYKNPKESSHTLVEVKKWFNKYNIEYLTSIPFDKINKDTKIFEKHNLEYPFLSIKEISMMFSLSQIKEGGFFVVIGKKK